MIKFAFGFAWMVIMLWSCSTDPGKVGLDLLPTGDLVNVKNLTETNIKAYAVTDGHQRTDKTAYNLLGTLNDPIFGKTTADFACQFRLSYFPDFSKDAQPDSIVLYLYYKQLYGDTTTQQHFRVYELGSDLSYNSKYYQDENLKGYAKPEILADYSYTPKFKLDSLTNYYGSTKAKPKDTVYQKIAIKLDLSLANYLMSADSLKLSDNDLFVKYFKGLYVEASELNSGGSIMKINTTPHQYTVGQQTISEHGSYLVLHYHNSEKDSLYYSYGITKNSAARVSHFVHDYSTTSFSSSLNADISQENLIYLQPTGGLRAKIMIPDLGYWSKMNPELLNDKDTTKLVINRAQLVFTIDPEYIDTVTFLPPERLLLAAIGPGKSKVFPDQDSIYYLSDYTFSPAYFGGYYNSSDHTYRFNIAKHMDDLLEADEKKRKQNLGFYLETLSKNTTFNRVVLTGTKGIRLEVTYSRLN